MDACDILPTTRAFLPVAALLLPLLGGGTGLSGCAGSGGGSFRSAHADDGEDEQENPAPICQAAEAADDACEEAFGEDTDPCRPFDEVDEACESQTPDPCATAEALDDACEELFGDDAGVCAPLDAIDESCEDEGDEDDDEGDGDGDEGDGDGDEGDGDDDAISVDAPASGGPSAAR